MGSLQATEMAALAGIEEGIRWHLQCNHFPPVPEEMVEVCILAIEAAREDDWDGVVGLPDGITYQGETEAPVYAIVSQHHLDTWVTTEEETC